MKRPKIQLKKKKLNSKIKLPKPISNQLKNLLAFTIHSNLDKRYNWKKFLDDPFIKIKYCEDIRTNPNNLSNDIKKIEDNQMERFSESLLLKAENIYKYYSNLFSQIKILLIS